jgi:tetratricopeptide (TPR) repeat protein
MAKMTRNRQRRVHTYPHPLPKGKGVHTTVAPARNQGRNWLIIGCAVLLGAALWAYQAHATHSQEVARLQDGLRLLQNGDGDQAAATWEDLRGEYPGFPDSYLQLAKYYTGRGDPQRAVGVLDDMRTHGLTSGEGAIDLAEAYAKMKDPRALAAGVDAVRLAPHSLRAHMALMAAYTQIYDRPHAVAQLMIAEQIAPKVPSLYLAGAAYMSDAYDYAGAEQQARGCIAVDPQIAEAWYMLGLALGNQPTPAHLGEAATDLQKSIALSPDRFAVWLELGDVFLQENRVPDAGQCLEKARSLGDALHPQGNGLRKILQDRIRIDHLLLEVYTRQGNTAGAAVMRRETDQLNEQEQRS